MKHLLVLTLCALASTSSAQEYERAPQPTRVLSAGELAIKVLVEQQNLGSSEVEIGEITFPADYQARGHSHGAIEIFYVLEGRMNIEIGMAAVRPAEFIILKFSHQLQQS